MFFEVKYRILGNSVTWIDVFGYLTPVLHQFIGDFAMVFCVHVTPIGRLVIMIGQAIQYFLRH